MNIQSSREAKSSQTITRRLRLPLALIVLGIVVAALAMLPGGGVASATWAAPAALNSNAAVDGTSHDAFIQVTTDGAGNWVAVWFSNDTLGGTIGADNDILVARSTDNGATWTAPAPLNNSATTATRTKTAAYATLTPAPAGREHGARSRPRPRRRGAWTIPVLQ